MITTTPKLTALSEYRAPAPVAGRAANSRRNFLLRCSTLIAAAAVAPLAVAVGAGEIETKDSSLPEMKDRSLDDLRYSTFARQAKSRFRVLAGPGRTVELELAEVTIAKKRPLKPGQSVPGDAANEKFSLIFTGPREDLLPQRIYKFEHDKIGRFEMFIAPVAASDTSRIYYQAVFNRPIKTKVADQ